MAIRDIYHDADTIQRSVQCGAWSNATLDDHLQQHARERGDKVAIVDRRWRLTFADLDRLARRVAGGLLHLGLTSGDVISIQTPNWAEWLIAHCAATKIGAVTNSIGAMYRHKEVGYILDYAETALMLIPDAFRGFSHTDMLAELWPKLGNLRHVARDRGPRATRDALVPGVPRHLLGRPQLTRRSRRPAPGSEPRGDPHVHLRHRGESQRRDAYPQHPGPRHAAREGDLRPEHGRRGLHGLAHRAHDRLDRRGTAARDVRHDDRLAGTLEPRRRGRADRARGMHLSRSPPRPFLHGFVHAPNANRDTLRTFRLFGCGGAPIPRELVRRAEDEHGFDVAASTARPRRSSTARHPRSTRRDTAPTADPPDVEARLVDPDTGSPKTRAKRASSASEPPPCSRATTRSRADDRGLQRGSLVQHR